jgi:hypothetical protein
MAGANFFSKPKLGFIRVVNDALLVFNNSGMLNCYYPNLLPCQKIFSIFGLKILVLI